uniref:Putative ovule protein n=1 Tax=Solanum chacoense TaxID=4108 RepID=A0A0V0H865_SOLCH
MFPDTLSTQKTSFAEDGKTFLTHMPQSHMPQFGDVGIRLGRNCNSTCNSGSHKVYNVPDLCAFTITRAPIDIFIRSPSPVYLHPRDSRVPNEMRFFFKSGTYITSVRVLTTPSCILI